MNNSSQGTKEWSSESVNFISGCKNDCKYCYSRATAIYNKRKTQEDWKEEIVKPSKLNKGWRLRKDGRIMLASSHDITPQHLPEAIHFLKNILTPGNHVLIVSKPHLECIKAICDKFVDYKEKILFRFTIGSSDNATLKFWEPGAPSFLERVSSLKYAYDAGYCTSISCEPMLDDKIDLVIEAVRSYVTHSIWLGKMTKMKWRLEMNTEITEELKKKANQLYAWQSDDEIRALYQRYKNDPLIRWKGEIKTIVGIPIGATGADE
ncbi:MAG: radical SAM protein [Ignavibacteriaceae bacterium]|jgi:DNA repair photolyase